MSSLEKFDNVVKDAQIAAEELGGVAKAYKKFESLVHQYQDVEQLIKNNIRLVETIENRLTQLEANHQKAVQEAESKIIKKFEADIDALNHQLRQSSKKQTFLMVGNVLLGVTAVILLALLFTR